MLWYKAYDVYAIQPVRLAYVVSDYTQYHRNAVSPSDETVDAVLIASASVERLSGRHACYDDLARLEETGSSLTAWLDWERQGRLDGLARLGETGSTLTAWLDWMRQGRISTEANRYNHALKYRLYIYIFIYEYFIYIF